MAIATVAVALAGLLLMHGLSATVIHADHMSDHGHVSQPPPSAAEDHVMHGGCPLGFGGQAEVPVSLGSPGVGLVVCGVLDVPSSTSHAVRPAGRTLLSALSILRT